MPHSPGWVRLKRKPHQGDTAFVADVDIHTLLPTLWIIPRLPTSASGLSNKGKKGCYQRPQQALFDPGVIRRTWGSTSVKTRDEALFFKKKMYCEGFLVLKTDDFAREDVLPTREELSFFQRNLSIPRGFIQATYSAIDASAFQKGNRVLVTRGEYQGNVGTVINVAESVADVEIPAFGVVAPIDCNVLQKEVRVGDEVKVLAGHNAGFVGWVVSTAEVGAVIIYKDDKEVGPKSIIVYQTLILVLF